MPNESIISVPPNVTDPVVLRRFLLRLVEQLDIVIGNRTGEENKYVKQQSLIDEANKLEEDIKKAQAELNRSLELVSQLNDRVTKKLEADIEEINIKDAEQDDAITAIQVVDNNQDLRLDSLESAGYIADAPSDGNTYGRKDGSWEIV